MSAARPPCFAARALALVVLLVGALVQCSPQAVGPDDPFAVAVATDGARALVGVATEGDGRGAVHVYRRDGDGWQPAGTLPAPDAASGDAFGHAVALSGARALVGVPYDDALATDSGAARIYREDGGRWRAEATLRAPAGTGLDFFGWAVALDGELAVVGAPFDDDAATDCGAAFVFRFDGSTWVEEAKLVAADAGRSDRFGSAVAVSGDTIVVGAPWSDAFTGAAYVYRQQGGRWQPEARLVAHGADSRDRFGTSVAAHADVVVVGAVGDDGDGGEGQRDAGAAHVFRRVGGRWTGEARLAPPAPVPGGAFGLTVAYDGHRAAIGSRGAGDVTGALALFEHRADGAWALAETLVARAGAPAACFGFERPVARTVGPLGRRAEQTFALTQAGLAEEFDDLLALVEPSADEAHWEKIHWHVDLAAARARAVEEDKPLLIWRMVGEPLGFC